ncbi:DUF6180 family protein [Xanthobacteraceae bacterium A53D]
MRQPRLALGTLLLGTLALSPALAASDEFLLEHRVDRIDASVLSLDACSEIVQSVAQQAGLTRSVNRFPGQLVTITGGPRDGGLAFIVHCIAVDGKTVAVVQALDYSNQKAPAAALADKMRAALIAGK